MKLTANFGMYREKSNRNPHIASLEFLHKAGFEGMDINLHGAIVPGNYLAGDDWQRGIEEVAETAERLGMDLDQCHLPFYNFCDPAYPMLEEHNRMFGRMIDAAAILGVKWAVVHPGNACDSVQGLKESKWRTIEYIKPFIEQAEKYGIGIAMENLFVPRKLGRVYRYCARGEEVCDLVDSLDGNVGVCWDFGHANLIKDDQAECLRMIGKRLKVLHVHDNDGERDDHQVPFTYSGTVEWERILPVLKEIGYEGSFNFEVINNKMPNGAAEGFGMYMYQLGREMIRMIEG